MEESKTEEEISAPNTASKDDKSEERAPTPATPTFHPFAMERPAPAPLPSQARPFEMRTAQLQVPSASADVTAPAVAGSSRQPSSLELLSWAVGRETAEKKKRKEEEKAKKAAAKKAEKDAQRKCLEEAMMAPAVAQRTRSKQPVEGDPTRTYLPLRQGWRDQPPGPPGP